MSKGREPGTWKCRGCTRYNRPSMTECRHCGADKPPPKPKPKPRKKRGHGINVKARSAAKKKAEKDSRMGSNDTGKKMNEEQKRKARGRALASSPIANRIERGMRQRLAEADNG